MNIEKIGMDIIDSIIFEETKNQVFCKIQNIINRGVLDIKERRMVSISVLSYVSYLYGDEKNYLNIETDEQRLHIYVSLFREKAVQIMKEKHFT